MNARTKTPSPLAELLASLTERDRKMLDLLAAGGSSASLATALGYQEGTMRVYLHHLYAKIGVSNKTNAVIWWMASKSGISAHDHPDKQLVDWIADQVAAAAKMDDSGARALQRARLMTHRFNELVKRRVHPRDALRRAVAEARQ